MREELIIAGFGGQGVMFAGTLLAHAAMEEGKFVTFFPSYGAEVRGGTANSSVIISATEIGSPVVIRPDTLIILNQPSLDRFAKKLKDTGQMILNSTLIQDEAENKLPQKITRIPASGIAEEMGNIRVANMVALGAYLKLKPVVKLESVAKALEILLTGKKAVLVEINKKALNAGYEFK
jgi:2-oxoglutarate ferredoxin oxidoreductase subunit gamma